MKTALIFFFLLFGLYANAQQNYDASLIPKELLPYASSVIRNQEVTVEVRNLDNTIYHFKQAVTVLNKNGDDDAEIVVWHDKVNSIRYVKGTIYDQFGKPVRKFSESQFENASGNDGFSLYNDEKVEYFKPSVPDYPYTVEYEYEIREELSFIFRDWEPNDGTGIAVEKSSYTVSCKPGFNIRYKEINMPSSANESTDQKSGLKTYNWQVNNLKAIKYEPYEPNPDKYLSKVKIAPEKFQYGDYTGSFSNWNEFGKWMYDKLLADRRQLPAETIEYVKQLTAGISDPNLKAKKIYEYMQSKTHYVSVQVGIGGYQPFPASDVDKLNYGDCKALVNYTQSLLNAVGIDSYYCEVHADDDNKISLLKDFASRDQSNHIILCLPFKNDTTWCDCTSQTMPFGYLGDFTDDRVVLACTSEGGKLLRTPKYTAQDNLQKRKADFNLAADGTLSGDMTTIFKGVQYEDRERVISESLKEQLKLMPKYYPIANLDIEKLQFKQDKSIDPVTTEDVKLTAPEYASADDGKLNLLLNATNRTYHPPKQVMNRKTDVYINEGYTDEDEIVYTLPAGYHSDSNNLDVSLKTPFGNFNATSSVKDGKLIYKRKMQIIDGTYPKDTYQDLVDFYRSVVDADEYTVTLVKN
jgi:transglutaminase-like putative cysteine protease